MASRRAVLLLGLAAAVLAGAVLRLSTYRQLRAGPRTRAVSADDYYHLRRARFSVAHFPRTIFFDPLMNFPAGGVSIWPPLFDLALAAPSLILHGPDASRQEVGREAAWVPLVLGVATVPLALPAALVAAATFAWTQGLPTPFTYISFGFFQPVFLAALAAGLSLLDTAIGIGRRCIPARGLVARAIVLTVLAALVVPFVADLVKSFAGGVGYVAGRTVEASGRGGYVSYPSGWLKGIFETRPLFADGIGLPLRQLSLALFWTPVAIVVWVRRALAGPRPGVHAALAIWGCVTLFLAVSQRLNVYYAVPLCALATIEASRFAAARIRKRSRPPDRPRERRITLLVALALAVPMAAGTIEEVRAEQGAGSDLLATLGWMHQTLPRAIDPYDARLFGPPPYPAGLARASSVLAPWALGHLILYEAELPVVANNFGYGFVDSIRFFLASSEAEALAIARGHRARWIVAADLVPRMNDYAEYLGGAPLLEQTGGGFTPRRGNFETMQSR